MNVSARARRREKKESETPRTSRSVGKFGKGTLRHEQNGLLIVFALQFFQIH